MFNLEYKDQGLEIYSFNNCNYVMLFFQKDRIVWREFGKDNKTTGNSGEVIAEEPDKIKGSILESLV